MSRLNLYWLIPTSCLVIVAGCSSQLGPSDSEFKQQLQNQIPPYWEVSSLDVKEKENVGTKVEPNVASRFQASAKLNEDTFFKANEISSIDAERQQDITFISQAERKGKTVDLYGVANSTLVSEKWNTVFRFNENPTGSFGQTRSTFSGRTILRNSKEEEEFIDGVKKKIELQRVALVESITNNRAFSGERLNTSGAGRNFKLSFTKFDAKSGNLSGEMIFPETDAVFAIEGKLSGLELIFDVTKPIRGGNLSTQDAVYTLRLIDSKILKGKREYTPSFGSLFFFNAEKNSGRRKEDITLTFE